MWCWDHALDRFSVFACGCVLSRRFGLIFISVRSCEVMRGANKACNTTSQMPEESICVLESLFSFNVFAMLSICPTVWGCTALLSRFHHSSTNRASFLVKHGCWLYWGNKWNQGKVLCLDAKLKTQEKKYYSSIVYRSFSSLECITAAVKYDPACVASSISPMLQCLLNTK